MGNFIVKSVEPCCDCGEEVAMYRLPLPQDAVSFNYMDGFQLELDEDELRVLYLAILEHMTDVADIVTAA